MDGGSPVCSFMSSHSRYVNKQHGRNLKSMLFMFDLEEGWNYIQTFVKTCFDVVCALNLSSLQMWCLLWYGNFRLDVCLLAQGLGCHNIHVLSFEL